MATTTATREAILGSLAQFIRQRPGINTDLFPSMPDYRRAIKRAAKDLAAANEMLSAVALRPTITADDIARAAMGGALGWQEHSRQWVYMTQHRFWEEYRKAAGALLAHLLWQDLSDCAHDYLPAPDDIHRELRRMLSRTTYLAFFRKYPGA